MTTIFPAKVKEQNGITRMPGFIAEVVLAVDIEDDRETDFQLSLWKDEGKPLLFILAGFDGSEYSYAGIGLTPDQIDEFCAQLQKAKDILLRELDP